MMDDCVTKILKQRGERVIPYRLSDSSAAIGVTLFIDDVEITYRVEGDCLIFIIFRQVEVLPGLNNAFAPVIWFLTFLKTEAVAIKTVKAVANPLPRAGEKPPLDKVRLKRFYQRYFKAVNTVYDLSSDWLKLDLVDFDRRFNRW